MATFVVEDGTGLANANAYITATEARTYWAAQGVTFTQLDSAADGVVTLQTLIVAATRYIETRFGGTFKGEIEFPPTESPVFAGQALAFPRVCLYDRNGYPVTGVPRKVKDATAEYMRRAITASLMPDPTVANNLTRKRDKVGPVETEVEFVAGAVPLIQPYPAADLLMREFTFSGNYAVR